MSFIKTIYSYIINLTAIPFIILFITLYKVNVITFRTSIMLIALVPGEPPVPT